MSLELHISQTNAFILISLSLYKIKSAATEVTAQKTQTPIVAKLTQCEMGVNAYTKQSGICIFIKFYLYYVCRNKRIIPEEKYTHFHIY